MSKQVRKISVTLILAVIAVFFMFPLLLTFSNSFMSEAEITANYNMVASQDISNFNDPATNKHARLNLIPEDVTISQYLTTLFDKPQFLTMFWNSVKMVTPIVAGQTIVGTLAAYAFAKLKFRWKNQLFLLYIIVMLMPFQVTLVPNYLVADKLGLVNSPWAFILPGIFSAFGVFLLKQFMEQIPDAYIEAAKVDGAGQLDIFFRIVLPMSKAGIAAMAILVFIDSWNMVEQPLIFLQDAVKQPLSLYLSRIVTGEKGIAFAASTLYMLPVLLIFLYAENYLVDGIKNSGMKG